MGKIQIGTIELPDAELMYLRVILKVNRISMRSYVSECVRGNLIRMRNLYRDRIAVAARSHGISWEHCFNLYLNHSEPFTTEKIEATRQLPISVARDYGLTNLGNEK